MTDAQRLAVSNARRALLETVGDAPQVINGSIRVTGSGFEVRFLTEQGAFLVRTLLDGTVENVTDEKVH
jgi:hypothetical protein